MAAAPHIVILGAGLIGLSSADALLRGGAKVTILETREDILSGTSFANSGMIHPSQACRWDGAEQDPKIDADVQDLALRSKVLLDARMKDLGLKAMAQRPSGCFQLFGIGEAADSAFARHYGRGNPVVRLTATSSPFDREALFFPQDQSGDARLYGLALASSIKMQGGIIRAGVKSVRLALSESGAANLEVDDATIIADHIVVACGHETSIMLSAVGLHLPLEPVRGWSADFARSEAALDLVYGSKNIPLVPIMDAPSRSALTPFDDCIRLSGTWGSESVDDLLERWTELAPDLMAMLGEPLSTWSGERPVSTLGRPIIDQTSIKGLWVNAGHGHMGWTLCAGSGELMAEMILNGVDDPRFAFPA